MNTQNNLTNTNKTLYIAQAALIAATYTVLTMIAAGFDLASGAIQVRFSEALTILPFFTPAAIPGLTLGCLISNIVTGCALPDIIFGSLATLIGALGSYALRKYKFAVPVPPILANTVIVPFVLFYGYGVNIPIPLQMLTVGLGEVLSCGVIGLIFLLALEKYRDKIPGFNNFHG